VRVFVAVGALVAVLVAVVAAAVLLAGGDDEAGVAEVRLAGDQAGVRGVAFFEQDGERMTGDVVVWGLEPNSEHAVHFHGPDSRCGAKADPVAVHPDLMADENGVAYTDVEITAEQELLRGGFYYNVHAGPSSEADNPEIACGDIASTNGEAFEE
jgi:hypothetical protein